ncbi:lytic transglycosylase domain-containing protein [Pararhizobium sp.]|uniref:lytic transglycosylase domain-containing protein n=1 Tax=Pararhizobium sp. TaxID=1977563 RepID=UPI00272762D2|nr:lytic transglycosylase domain-containing protein [Pararhizobium sp.]MDO9414581.1 lytic transglycosylase domain-containing protein [Pararhizobium sp.]
MTKFGFSFSRQALAAVSLIALTAVAGCETSQQTARKEEFKPAQAVVPVTKPDEKTAALVTPSTENAGATVAALSEQGKATGAESAIALATQTGTPIPQAKPALDAQTAATTIEVTEAVMSMPAGEKPVQASMTFMESDFDSGEPVGLETLVAKEMIVPIPKPQLVAVAYNKTTEVVSSLLGLEDKPTSSRPELDRLIKHYADLNGIPEELVHRVVKRESTYNPRAYSKGNYGLMQIRYNTAKGLGYQGTPEGLFDAETNLKYATKYLRGAWLVADNKNDGAVRLYASGYYYHAKKKGMLDLVQ